MRRHLASGVNIVIMEIRFQKYCIFRERMHNMRAGRTTMRFETIRVDVEAGARLMLDGRRLGIFAVFASWSFYSELAVV
jgi:hypothetical protein